MDQVSSALTVDLRSSTNRSKFSLNGKTAVITGGARGLGFAFAEILSEAGAAIAILDIGTPKEGSLDSLASKNGVEVRYQDRT
jgi:NAD(P)-dependent dehydrogenase (short-subunit alcohol dehydrogenase family)